MVFQGTELLSGLEKRTLKLVFNENGAIVFPASAQHRHQKLSGISYEDDYAGNALAAMITPDRVEIRFHQDYSDERVQTLVATMLRHDELAPLRTRRVLYQGRALKSISS